MKNTHEILTNQYNAWIDKLFEGDPSYTNIIRDTRNGIWYIFNRNTSKIITELKIAIDDGTGVRPEYSYDINLPEVDPLASSMVIKDGNKIIMQDSCGINAFGIEGVQAPAKAFYIYVRTSSNTFIYAFYSADEGSEQYSLSLSGSEAISHCMDEIFVDTFSDTDE